MSLRCVQRSSSLNGRRLHRVLNSLGYARFLDRPFVSPIFFSPLSLSLPLKWSDEESRFLALSLRAPAAKATDGPNGAQPALG